MVNNPVLRVKKRQVPQHCVWGAHLQSGRKGEKELEDEPSISENSVLA